MLFMRGKPNGILHAKAKNEIAKRLGTNTTISEHIFILKRFALGCLIFHHVEQISLNETIVCQHTDWLVGLKKQIPQNTILGVIHKPNREVA